ncbi:MAG: lamin tail domain-containing protein [Sedimentisphaerales bacterium]|nr:lamin tail domain-containing protein [Sedimentisphaerales bacterium]
MQAQLKVDFNSTNQDGGPHNQAGWSAYNAGHEVAADFVTVNYDGITVTPTWPNTTANTVQQMIDRGAANDATWNDAAGDLNLVTDWIGIDTRTGNGGNGDWNGTAGTPTYLDLTIGGLPTGDYGWTSFHHDTEHCHGPFAVWLSTDGGVNFTQLADGLMTDSTPGGTPDSAVDGSYGLVTGPNAYTLPSTYHASFIANGTDDVVMRFALYAGVLGSAVHNQIWGMNGFVIESQNPCANQPPVVQGASSRTALTGEGLVMDVTVTDDGKPYLEGCDPEDPDTGTPYGLQYQWSQQSGPVPVSFHPPAADLENTTVTFPRAGTYELRLQVWDGPVGPGVEEGKLTEYFLTVEVLEPLDGDINLDGVVDHRDLWILTGQWLDMPACQDVPYCADLDYSGAVTLDDYALLADNWLFEHTKVTINEFVASNQQSFLDGDGHSSDWIELYNGDTVPVSLAGWYLTDERSNPRKWPFPAPAVLSAGGYLVVFASEQPTDDYVDSEGYYHTNFALDKEGDYLALVSPLGRIVHEYFPEYPPQETDVSYGMWFTLFRYFASPTPGRPNAIQYQGFTEATIHSRSRGFYDQPFDLRISCATPGAVIRYTLDGSEPAEQAGILYDPNTTIAITTTTVVRSVAFKPGWRTAKVSTHSYLFVDHVAQQPADPAGWPDTWGYDGDLDGNDGDRGDENGIIPSDYEMDPRVVGSTLPGYSVREALLDIPTVSISMLPVDFITENESNGIYSNPLSRWERKCSIEYIRPDGVEGFQHDCQIEVHGNASRRPFRMQKHSLRLTFTSLYGPSKLDYPLFPESEVERFNQLVLRACFTDSWGLVSWGVDRYRPNDSQYIRDVWIKDSLFDMGQPSSHGNFVHLYVDGLYFGVHNLTERLRGEFFADHLGGEPADWEINEDFATPGARWNAMMAIDPSTLAGYEQIREYLDVENFADYMLLHFYADAEDWPVHNGYAAANAKSHDGKFRFFVWDQEIILDYHGRGASRIDSTGGAGSVFQKMRTSAEFRLLFADRVYKHLFNGGALNVAHSRNRYLSIANGIDKAIVAESARWGDTQMSTPYGNTIEQPSPLDNIDHRSYPPAPHGPDYYFTREDSWVVERDNVINNYIPANHDTNNSYAIVNVFRSENLYPNVDPPQCRINGSAQHGGYAEPNAVFSLTLPQSQTYTDKVYVDEFVPVRAHVPTDDSLGLTWTEPAFAPDPLTWTDGWTSTGVGYERDTGYDVWINTYVEAEMYGISSSVFCRIEFENDGAQTPELLELHMRYDDGFIAYLNGGEVELADSGNIVDAVPGTAAAYPAHEAGQAYVIFPVTAAIDRLQPGTNVLAIHGINASATSTDMLILPKLVGKIPAGEIPPEGVWFTANNEDPRLAGGSINPHAAEYTNPFALTHSTVIKARTFDNGEWSALAEAVYAVGPVAQNLRITELMYHPAGDPNAEFIEVMNIHPTDAINLALVRFTNGVEFEFPSLYLAAGQRAVVVKDGAAFHARYPSFDGIIAGAYAGSLGNDGEEIDLVDALGAKIHDFDYEDGWYEITDGLGFSLTIRDPYSGDPNDWDAKDGWRASVANGGSPGGDDSDFVLPAGAIIVNELLAHAETESSDWVEFYNTTDDPVNIGGWFISDDGQDLMKYEIAEPCVVPDHGYAVFYADTHFGPESTNPGVITPFAFSENGEKVYLTSGAGGALTGVYSTERRFGASQPDVAFGHYVKSTGSDFVAMSANTPNDANADPKVGPVVINEIAYHPQSDGDAEFVELVNISGGPVTLYDAAKLAAWRFVDDADDDTPSLEYLFPVSPPVTLAPGEYFLLVKDKAAFESVFLGGGDIGTLGVQWDAWGGGSLNNGGEQPELQMPGDPGYYIRVDRVTYSDGSHPAGGDPWPPQPDDSDVYSLQRRTAGAYGNDVINWIWEPYPAATPGAANPIP